jgi:hypothetical protein
VKKRLIFEILRFDISERNSAKRCWGQVGVISEGVKVTREGLDTV